MNEDYFIIVVDGATDVEIDSVHSFIKRNSDVWWHHFEAAWVVKGLSAKEWRDELKGLMHDGSSSLLVFKLPNHVEDREWSFNGPDAKARCEWLHGEIR